jgi:hypothetical protein
MGISRTFARFYFFALLTALFVVTPAKSCHAADIAPPGPDETLIYVLRTGKFVGGGVKVWVAVNDQTVAKLSNKGYAVVRAKAGAITLNLASAGMVLAAIAVDDRPGQTVYLQWGIGDYAFEVLDAQKGAELVQASEQTEPIEAALPNNEQVQAFVNLSRLGFDLMKPASDRLMPDSQHAVLTIFRKSDNPKLHFGVWAEDRYIGTLSANEGIDVPLTPCEHFFGSGHVGSTLLKAQVEAGKHYYAVLDVGAMVLRVHLNPIAKRDSAQLKGGLDSVKFVRLDTAAMAPRALERELTYTDFVRSSVDKAKSGKLDFTALGSDHAF